MRINLYKTPRPTRVNLILNFYVLYLGLDRVDEIQQPRNTVKKIDLTHASDTAKVQEASGWGNYARGAVYALQSRGKYLAQVKIYLVVVLS